jgi:hypothetical protein
MAKDKGAVGDLSPEEIEAAGLSPEEREALGHTDADELETLKAVAEGDGGADDGADEGDEGKGKKDAEAQGGADDEGDQGKDAKDKKQGAAEDEDDDGDGGADAAAQAAAKKAAEDKAAEAAAVAEEDDDDDLPPLPVYKAPPVEDYDKKVKALDDKAADLEAKFKAGDIELSELLSERDKVAAERAELREAKFKHELSVEQEQQAQAAGWQYEVQSFMRRVKKADGVDYAGNALLNAALDKAVKDLADDEKNADKSGKWFLREAHKKVLAAIGRTPAAPAAGTEDKGGEGGKPKPGARKPDLKVVPKTLGGLPAGGDDDAGGDPEFAHLDGLDGLDLEAEVARMSPAQQERYARSK